MCNILTSPLAEQIWMASDMIVLPVEMICFKAVQLLEQQVIPIKPHLCDHCRSILKYFDKRIPLLPDIFVSAPLQGMNKKDIL